MLAKGPERSQDFIHNPKASLICMEFWVLRHDQVDYVPMLWKQSQVLNSESRRWVAKIVDERIRNELPNVP